MKTKQYKLFTNAGLIQITACNRKQVKQYAKRNNEIISLYGIKKVV